MCMRGVRICLFVCVFVNVPSVRRVPECMPECAFSPFVCVWRSDLRPAVRAPSQMRLISCFCGVRTSALRAWRVSVLRCCCWIART